MNSRKLKSSRSQARFKGKKTDEERSSVVTGLPSHRSTKLPPFKLLQQSRKMSLSQPLTERLGRTSTLVSARSTLLSRPPLPTKRTYEPGPESERVSFHMVQQIAQIRQKYFCQKHRQKRRGIDYLPIVDKHKEELCRYDEAFNLCQYYEQEIKQKKERLRQLEETRLMMSEDAQSRQNERVNALIVLEESEELLDLYYRQYPEEAHLIDKQEQHLKDEEQLERQLKLFRESIRKNEQKWSECQKNLNVKTRHLHLNEVIKATRLQLLEREERCSALATTLGLKTLRHLICNFAKQHESKHTMEKENGLEVWLCANGLMTPWMETIQRYRKTASNAELNKNLDSYLVTLRKLEGLVQGKGQCNTLRKHHQSISQHYQSQIQKINEELGQIASEKEELKTRLDLLLAQEKELYLKDLDLEFVDGKAIGAILRRINTQQNNRIERVRQSKLKLKEASAYLNKCRASQPEQRQELSASRQLQHQQSAIIAELKRLTGELSHETAIRANLQKKLSKAVSRVREDSNASLHTKIESLCYQLGRMERQLTEAQEKNSRQTVKQVLSVIPESTSQDRHHQDILESKTLKNEFQTNRDLLKSTCLSYFGQNDPGEFTRVAPLASKILSVRSSVIGADELRPRKASAIATSASNLLARSYR